MMKCINCRNEMDQNSAWIYWCPYCGAKCEPMIWENTEKPIVKNRDYTKPKWNAYEKTKTALKFPSQYISVFLTNMIFRNSLNRLISSFVKFIFQANWTYYVNTNVVKITAQFAFCPRFMIFHNSKSLVCDV